MPNEHLSGILTNSELKIDVLSSNSESAGDLTVISTNFESSDDRLSTSNNSERAVTLPSLEEHMKMLVGISNFPILCEIFANRLSKCVSVGDCSKMLDVFVFGFLLKMEGLEICAVICGTLGNNNNGENFTEVTRLVKLAKTTRRLQIINKDVTSVCGKSLVIRWNIVSRYNRQSSCVEMGMQYYSYKNTITEH
ncbi:hypothetical protein FQR65_LT02846 [Abscondita terminalis]|nr:hypothetical protein FQR65_LT02846 [Abscondita terminalis]